MSIDQQFINAMTSTDRNFNCIAYIYDMQDNNGNTPIYTLSGNDYLVSFKIVANSYGNNKLFGTSSGKSLQAEFINKNSMFNFENKEIELFVQVKYTPDITNTYPLITSDNQNFITSNSNTFNVLDENETAYLSDLVSLGRFVILKIDNDKVGYHTKIEATDYTIKLDKEFNINLPMLDKDKPETWLTLGTFARYICLASENTLYSEVFPMSDLALTELPFIQNDTIRNNQDNPNVQEYYNVAKYRDALASIADIATSFTTIRPDNNTLEFKQYYNQPNLNTLKFNNLVSEPNALFEYSWVSTLDNDGNATYTQNSINTWDLSNINANYVYSLDTLRISPNTGNSISSTISTPILQTSSDSVYYARITLNRFDTNVSVDDINALPNVTENITFTLSDSTGNNPDITVNSTSFNSTNGYTNRKISVIIDEVTSHDTLKISLNLTSTNNVPIYAYSVGQVMVANLTEVYGAVIPDIATLDSTLKFCTINNNSNNYIIPPCINYSDLSEYDETIPINKVALTRRPLKGLDVVYEPVNVSDDESNIYAVNNNQIIFQYQNTDDYPVIAEDIYSSIGGFNYKPYKVIMPSLPIYNLGDKFQYVKLETTSNTPTENDIITSIISKYTIEYDGGMTSEISAQADTKADKNYSKQGTFNKALQLTDIIVNKNQNLIIELNEKQTEQGINFNNEISNIYQTIRNVGVKDGNNKIPNSVGWAKIDKDNDGSFTSVWSFSGVPNVNVGTSQTLGSVPNGLEQLTVSKSAIWIQGGNISQTIIDGIVPGIEYALCFKLNKPQGVSGTFSINYGNTVTFTYPSSAVYNWSSKYPQDVYNYTETDLTGIVFTPTINQVTITFTNNVPTDKMWISDLMLSFGNQFLQWSPYNNEVYGTLTQIDNRGVVVYNSGDETPTGEIKSSATYMTPYGFYGTFTGYDNQEHESFRLDGNVMRTSSISIDNTDTQGQTELEIVPVVIISTPNLGIDFFYKQ